MDRRNIPGSGGGNQVSRRLFLGRSLTVAASASAAGFALAGCGGASTTDEQPLQVATKPPDYYPSDYTDIIEGSRDEGGQLAIYSNMAVYNWKPIIEAFQQRYPWVKEITTNNLDSGEVFQRYYNEEAAGTPAADFVVSGAPLNWIDFVEERKFALDYESPEIEHIPEWSIPLPGLYTFSTDPILMAYNKALLSEDQQPRGLAHLAQLIQQDPDTFTDKVTTYDIEGSFGFAINWHYAANTDGAWQKLETILPYVRPEGSSGPMVEKINSGEYLAGYFLSSTVVLPQAEDAGQILGWGYIADGTPLFVRGMAISKAAKRPNTAKLMLDFLLSQDGQNAVYRGGFTPYREDLNSSEVPRTYQSIANEVGEDNVVLIDYDRVSQDEIDEFRSRWDQALQG